MGISEQLLCSSWRQDMKDGFWMVEVVGLGYVGPCSQPKRLRSVCVPALSCRPGSACDRLRGACVGGVG